MEQEADYYKDVRELSVDVVDETGGQAKWMKIRK